jgi:hypothetical protein
MKRLFSVLALLMAFQAFSQTAPTSADIYLNLQKLNVLGSVLYVAAHPDDENTRLLAYFSKDRLYRTGYLSLTRGDGGQNLIGEEQGIDLGLIRHRSFWQPEKWTAPSNILAGPTILDFQKIQKKPFRSGIRKRYWPTWCGSSAGFSLM